MAQSNPVFTTLDISNGKNDFNLDLNGNLVSNLSHLSLISSSSTNLLSENNLELGSFQNDIIFRSIKSDIKVRAKNEINFRSNKVLINSSGDFDVNVTNFNVDTNNNINLKTNKSFLNDIEEDYTVTAQNLNLISSNNIYISAFRETPLEANTLGESLDMYPHPRIELGNTNGIKIINDNVVLGDCEIVPNLSIENMLDVFSFNKKMHISLKNSSQSGENYNVSENGLSISSFNDMDKTRCVIQTVFQNTVRLVVVDDLETINDLYTNSNLKQNDIVVLLKTSDEVYSNTNSPKATIKNIEFNNDESGDITELILVLGDFINIDKPNNISNDTEFMSNYVSNNIYISPNWQRANPELSVNYYETISNKNVLTDSINLGINAGNNYLNVSSNNDFSINKNKDNIINISSINGVNVGGLINEKNRYGQLNVISSDTSILDLGIETNNANTNTVVLNPIINGDKIDLGIIAGTEVVGDFRTVNIKITSILGPKYNINKTAVDLGVTINNDESGLLFNSIVNPKLFYHTISSNKYKLGLLYEQKWIDNDNNQSKFEYRLFLKIFDLLVTNNGIDIVSIDGINLSNLSNEDSFNYDLNQSIDIGDFSELNRSALQPRDHSYNVQITKNTDYDFLVLSWIFTGKKSLNNLFLSLTELESINKQVNYKYHFSSTSLIDTRANNSSRFDINSLRSIFLNVIEDNFYIIQLYTELEDIDIEDAFSVADKLQKHNELYFDLLSINMSEISGNIDNLFGSTNNKEALQIDNSKNSIIGKSLYNFDLCVYQSPYVDDLNVFISCYRRFLPNIIINDEDEVISIFNSSGDSIQLNLVKEQTNDTNIADTIEIVSSSDETLTWPSGLSINQNDIVYFDESNEIEQKIKYIQKKQGISNRYIIEFDQGICDQVSLTLSGSIEQDSNNINLEYTNTFSKIANNKYNYIDSNIDNIERFTFFENEDSNTKTLKLDKTNEINIGDEILISVIVGVSTINPESVDWDDMNNLEQTYWSELGWTETSWTASFGNSIENPPSESKSWEALTESEQYAASKLGYTKVLWTNGITLTLQKNVVTNIDNTNNNFTLITLDKPSKYNIDTTNCSVIVLNRQYNYFIRCETFLNSKVLLVAYIGIFNNLKHVYYCYFDLNLNKIYNNKIQISNSALLTNVMPYYDKILIFYVCNKNNDLYKLRDTTMKSLFFKNIESPLLNLLKDDESKFKVAYSKMEYRSNNPKINIRNSLNHGVYQKNSVINYQCKDQSDNYQDLAKIEVISNTTSNNSINFELASSNGDYDNGVTTQISKDGMYLRKQLGLSYTIIDLPLDSSSTVTPSTIYMLNITNNSDFTIPIENSVEGTITTIKIINNESPSTLRLLTSEIDSTFPNIQVNDELFQGESDGVSADVNFTTSEGYFCAKFIFCINGSDKTFYQIN